MSHTLERRSLLRNSPGSGRQILIHRFRGEDVTRKAYFQASLHADETPGMLVAHHLIRLLMEAEKEGAIREEIVVVPYANPIGLAQFLNGEQSGRYELGGGGNFNRNWPELAEGIAARITGKLGGDEAANVSAIRAAMRSYLGEIEPRKEMDSLRLILAREACDADIVMDMHCDDEALMHLYLVPQHWPEASDIASEIGCRAVLLAEDSGGASFDEAFSGPWIRLAKRFPEHPIPPACLAGTIELRGRPDVHDRTAETDARALFRVLQRRGFVAGDPGPLPTTLCEATQLDATDTIKAKSAGILSYTAELGASVDKDEQIAWLIDPAAENPQAARQPVLSGTKGFVLSRRQHKYVAPGMTIAKIVGKEPLPHRQGAYLLDD